MTPLQQLAAMHPRAQGCFGADRVETLGAIEPAWNMYRINAVGKAYPGRNIIGWDIWASDPKVEPIWFQIVHNLYPAMTAADVEKVRADNQRASTSPSPYSVGQQAGSGNWLPVLLVVTGGVLVAILVTKGTLLATRHPLGSQL